MCVAVFLQIWTVITTSAIIKGAQSALKIPKAAYLSVEISAVNKTPIDVDHIVLERALKVEHDFSFGVGRLFVRESTLKLPLTPLIQNRT